MRLNHISLSFVALVLILFCGCGRFDRTSQTVQVVPFEVTNLYPIERLPVYFNRVIVMPCHLAGNSENISEFADDIINQELAQARLFETVRFSTQSCKAFFR